jgi:hypothetical protein
MEFRDIGKHLPPTKWGEGWVEKRGKRRKVWVGFWYEYALIGEIERRRTRSREGSRHCKGDRRQSAERHDEITRGPGGNRRETCYATPESHGL